MRKILLVSTQRVGSNALRSILASNAGIVDVGEYLGSRHPRGLHTVLAASIREDPGFVPDAPRLRKVFERAMRELDGAFPAAEIGIVACKYNAFGPFNPYGWRLTEMPALLGFARKARYRVIHMLRRDVVGAYVSAVRASRSGQWHLQRGADAATADVALVFEREAFIAAIRLRIREMQLFRGFLAPGAEVIELVHEDCLVDGSLSDAAAAALESLLQRKLPLRGPAAYVRNPQPWTDSVGNLAEVRSWLAEDAELSRALEAMGALRG